MIHRPSRYFIHLLFLSFIVLNPFSLSHAVRVERVVDAWQPKHYAVDITLDEQLSEIVSANTRIDVAILKSTALIDLDFGEMSVDAVTLDSKPASFTHKDGK